MKLESLIFRSPEVMYSKDTPGFVDIGENGACLAAMQGGTAIAQRIVLYFHGNDEDIAESVRAMEAFLPPRTAIVGIAYPGCGLSDGEKSEANCHHAARRLYDWVRGELGYSPEEILIVGYSMGTAMAVKLAGDVKARAVVLQAPFTRARDVVARWYGEGKLREFAAEDDPFPSFDRIAAIESPVVILHGTDDEVVPYAMGERLYAKVVRKGGFHSVSGAGHCDLLVKFGVARYRELLENL